MKLIHTIIATFFVGLFCTAQVKVKKENIVWKSYTDSASSFNVQYPSDWFLKLTSEKAVFVLKSPAESEADNFLENINLIIRYLPAASKISIEDFGKITIDALKKKYSTFAIKSSKKITWLNKDAWESKYEFVENGMTVSVMQMLLFYNDNLYACTYSAQGNKTDIYFEMANEIFNRMSVK
jgi:hypothetical protein